MSESTERELLLGLIIREGFDIGDYAETAREAEAAKIHTLFVADSLSTDAKSPRGNLEPITLLSALAVLTTHTGLIGTISSTFTDPYTLARQVASLDHIANGRAGWNVVTSAHGEENFGPKTMPSHDERYVIAEEHMTVVEKLWASWGDGAISSRHPGSSVDASKVDAIDFVGEHFQVRGPLNISRTPQGRPIIAQAGTSEDGQGFGARHADLIFTAGQDSLEDSQEVYGQIKRRVLEAGRDPEHVKLMPGVFPIVAETDEEAQLLFESALSNIDYHAAVRSMAPMFGGVDLSGYDLDEPVPAGALPDESQIEGRRSRYAVLKRYLEAPGERRTLRDLVRYHSAAAGHWVVVGSPQRVADLLQERFESAAADGFIFIDAYNKFPGSLHGITRLLIPELQRRGLFHTEYSTDTLRGNFGLPEVA
jgi:FMN-dependent oxidoreductase (nitrilotriacetate monooxygenase family)